MEAKELRIGNWVNDHGDIVKVNAIGDGNITVAIQGFKSNKISVKNCKPIPLIGEWLLKFSITKWFINNRFEIRENEDNYCSVYAWNNGVCTFICDLKYVHQFQNLYFILTGEELEIKE